MRMQLTANPVSRALSIPVCGSDGFPVIGRTAGAVVDGEVVVVPCLGVAARAGATLVSAHNSSVTAPATNSEAARRR